LETAKAKIEIQKQKLKVAVLLAATFVFDKSF